MIFSENRRTLFRIMLYEKWISSRTREPARAGGDLPFTETIAKANGFEGNPNTLVYPVTPLD
jgi:hypothetical protein